MSCIVEKRIISTDIWQVLKPILKTESNNYFSAPPPRSVLRRCCRSESWFSPEPRSSSRSSTLSSSSTRSSSVRRDSSSFLGDPFPQLRLTIAAQSLPAARLCLESAQLPPHLARDPFATAKAQARATGSGRAPHLRQSHDPAAAAAAAAAAVARRAAQIPLHEIKGITSKVPPSSTTHRKGQLLWRCPSSRGDVDHGRR